MLELMSLLVEFFRTGPSLQPPRSFEALCDGLPFAVARIRNGVLDWINEEGWKQDGASRREEVIGARVNARWPVVDWEDRHRRVLASGKPASFTTPVQSASGQRVWICTTVFPAGPDTVVVIADDITKTLQNLARAAAQQAADLEGKGAPAPLTLPVGAASSALPAAHLPRRLNAASRS